MRTVALLALISQYHVIEAVQPASGKTETLLRQGSATAQEVSVHSNAGWMPGKPLWKSGDPINPEASGHMLTNYELKPLTSVQCLEAKQRNPSVNCDGDFVGGSFNGGQLNAGNFPNHWDPHCHSNGEYFCDPGMLLTVTERKKITDLMTKLRADHLVTCGPQVQHDPVDKWNYAPFALGVAIANEWPLHEADAQALNAFGKMLMGHWNLTYTWTGESEPYARCSLSAMLVILPDRRQAHLSSDSCMFICQEKGGPEVALTTLLTMDSYDLATAVQEGMKKAYEVIEKMSPMHDPAWQPREVTGGTYKTWERVPYQPPPRPWASTSMESMIWDWGQRVLFVIACFLLVTAFCTAFLVCYMSPGVAKELKGSSI